MDLQITNIVNIICGLSVVFLGFMYLSKSIFGYNSYKKSLFCVLSLFFATSVIVMAISLFSYSERIIEYNFVLSGSVMYFACLVTVLAKRKLKSKKTILSIHMQRELRKSKKTNSVPNFLNNSDKFNFATLTANYTPAVAQKNNNYNISSNNKISSIASSNIQSSKTIEPYHLIEIVDENTVPCIAEQIETIEYNDYDDCKEYLHFLGHDCDNVSFLSTEENFVDLTENIRLESVDTPKIESTKIEHFDIELTNKKQNDASISTKELEYDEKTILRQLSDPKQLVEKYKQEKQTTVLSTKQPIYDKLNHAILKSKDEKVSDSISRQSLLSPEDDVEIVELDDINNSSKESQQLVQQEQQTLLKKVIQSMENTDQSTNIKRELNQVKLTIQNIDSVLNDFMQESS